MEVKIKNFKVNALPLVGESNSRYYLRLPSGNKYIEYLTDSFGNYLSPSLPSVSISYEEVTEQLIGVINNSNATFTTTFNFDPNTTIVFINGIKQNKPLHYNTIGLNTIIFSDSPLIGDTLEINYVKL